LSSEQYSPPRNKMSRLARAIILLAVFAVVLLFVGSQRAWFAAEPAWRGKTVTEWLDRLVLYDFQTDATGTAMVPRSPERIATDPALEALLRIGPKATPILAKRLMERAQWDPNESRAKLWGRWLWGRVRHATPASIPAPDKWSEFQRRRKNAAAFTLLALGTNAHAGFGSFMEAYATAPKHESVSGTRIPGPPVGVYPHLVAQLATEVFPERKGEIFAEILKGLQHTNAWCREVAIECVSAFPEQLPRWKRLLLQLSKDEDESVRLAALGELLMIVQQPELHDAMTPAEIELEAKAVTEDAAASSRVKELAEVVLKLAMKATTTNRPVETAQPLLSPRGQ